MYTQIQRYDNEWVDVTHGQLLACCDCGLVHDINYHIIESSDGIHILRSAVRHSKATGARRRSLRMKKEGLWSDDMKRWWPRNETHNTSR